MNADGEQSKDSADESASDPLNGPHGWLNLQASQAGFPARSNAKDGVLLRPLWTEFALYSDARMTGTLPSGPLAVMLAFPAAPVRLGSARPELLLRVTDYLPSGRTGPYVPESQEIDAYVGGDIADEMASLLSLALGRRIRSGGVVRHCRSQDEPCGSPFLQSVPPQLGEPRHWPMLPGIADDVRIDSAQTYLERYARLAAADAVALLRAAHQYADAVWWADVDPRISWIKLFGAIEAAAGRWDDYVQPSRVEQLRRRHGRLHGRLSKHAPMALEIVADDLSRVIGAESKMIEFVLAYEPGPPERRPDVSEQVEWGQLRDALGILYGHRSRDLHGGIPFPPPLCEPVPQHAGVPAELFLALAMSTGRSSWPASALPMYLHVFADLVARTLRAWWLALPCADVFTEIGSPERPDPVSDVEAPVG